MATTGSSDSCFVWLRPATTTEEFMDCANRKGIFVTVYTLSLQCAVPLTDTLIEEALLHLFRKMPNLRLCFRHRGDTLWACDMNREDIDFQVTEMQEVVSAMEALLQYRFPTTEGPLWCARLLPATVSDWCCPDKESEAALQHRRTLVLANHHGIADGTSNMLMADAFLRLLDDVVAGNTINDAAQLGTLTAGETDAMLTARIEVLRMNQTQLQHLRDETKNYLKRKKLIPRAYPMPSDPDYRPEIVSRDLNQETTQDFVRKCKAEGVTVNSGLTAVFNVSLVDFVREGGLEQESYSIHETHSVNMRRYWSGDTETSLGSHAIAFNNVVSTPATWRDNFWDYARTVHSSLTQNLRQKDVVEYTAVAMMTPGTTEDYFASRPLPECDYGSANMGDVNRLIHTERQHVRLEHLLRVSSCWNDPMYQLCHTLHGRLSYSLIYCNDVLTRHNANIMVNKTFCNMKAVMRM